MAEAPSQDSGSLLSVRDITKKFGTNVVLKGVSLNLQPGEVLALIGGNGAGKSTLMKIIMGIYTQDGGELIVDGERVEHNNTKEALSRSIYMVPQEPLLFPNMNVLENVTIGFDGRPSELHKELLAVMDETGWHIDLERKANTLSIAEQQQVEILRGLMRKSKVLILDEPTSALTFDEVESLFECVKALKAKNIGIIYITHRLSEVFQIATQVAIMRDGIIAVAGDVSKFTKEDLVKGLLPPTKETAVEKKDNESVTIDYAADPVFELKDFSGYGFSNINMKIYPGEIVGLAGVVGAGRSEMATTVFGMDQVLGGKVYLEGKDITGFKTRRVIDSGLNYVSEDRFDHGIFSISGVAANMTSALLGDKRLGSFLLDKKEERRITEMYIDDFHIKTTDINQEIGSLSGGNQQKVVIGRSFSTYPKLVILDEPTRGIDAAARGDVYRILQVMRHTGVSILLISSDMEEIVELADRAFTMYQGRINHEFAKDEITRDGLMSAAFGAYSDHKKEVHS